MQNNKVKNLNNQLTAAGQEIQSLKTSNGKLEVSNKKLEDAVKSSTNTTAKTTTQTSVADQFLCGQPLISSSGGPLPGHTANDRIEFVTGQWIPANIDVKTGTTVTWVMDLGGEIPKLAVQSDTDSSETFSSPDLPTDA